MGINTKYKLTNITKEIDGHILHRIQALRDVSLDVHKGDLGGYIESERNLDIYDTSWIYDDAKVFEDSRVIDNAIVKNYAIVRGGSIIELRGTVRDSSLVCGKSIVSDNSIIEKFSIVKDKSKVKNYSWIRNSIIENQSITDFAIITNSHLSNNSRLEHCNVDKVNLSSQWFRECIIDGATFTNTLKENILLQTRCFPENNFVIAYATMCEDEQNYEIGGVIKEPLPFDLDVVALSLNSDFVIKAKINYDDIKAVQFGRIYAKEAEILDIYRN